MNPKIGDEMDSNYLINEVRRESAQNKFIFDALAGRFNEISAEREAVRVAVMTIVQFCAAFAGIIMSSSVTSASFTFGVGWEMDVIASVIIGGASLAGGSGTALGTMIGIIFLGVVNDIMALCSVSTAMQYVVQGGLVVFAVLLNSIHIRRKA